jgi:hypothetical protein
MSVKVVGHVQGKSVPIYELPSGTAVTFHTARDERGAEITFECPLNVWPSIVAGRAGIAYTFLRNATRDEVDALGLNYKEVGLA